MSAAGTDPDLIVKRGHQSVEGPFFGVFGTVQVTLFYQTTNFSVFQNSQNKTSLPKFQS